MKTNTSTVPVESTPPPAQPKSGLAELAKEPELTLQTALTAARAGLSRALQALIQAGVPDGDAERNATENIYETVKNQLAEHKPTLETLKQAAAELKKVAAMLANNSRAQKEDIAAVREAARVANKNLSTFA